MEYRILGPLEVRRGDRELELGGRMQRALLALLLLSANEVAPADRLIDDLWAGTPPPSAAKSLQVYVSRLRKLLGKHVLLTRAGGYVLELSEDELDVDRFRSGLNRGRRLLTVGDPAAASATLGSALTLWRGPPLADFRYDSFAQSEIARLEELQLAGFEERIEADLALGRHAELVPELEKLVKSSPLRERLRAQLMLSLYRSGRQVEALEAFAAARRSLVDELGIEPGRQLRELHQAVLRQDTTLDLEPAVESLERREPEVVEPPPAPVRSAREARKTVTAVCVRLAATTEHGGALDPEPLRRVTSRAFGEVQAAVERHGGTIETVTGEAITAVFGLPKLHEDDALRAARAAVEACGRLASLAGELEGEQGTRLAFRGGLSTGEVVAGGEAGSQLRATGEPLTAASALAQAGEPGEIRIDETTRRLVRHAVVAEPASGGSIPGDRLVRLEKAAPGPGGRFASPMVGRDRERRRLHGAFEQAVGDRSCQLFTVVGLAGVGKSRLVHEFLGDLSGNAHVARGSCLPYGEGITFWPLLEAVKEAAGLDDTDSAEEARGKLIRALGEEEGAAVVAQRVAEMIGLAEVRDPAEEGGASVRVLFEALARTRPLVLVFDDIHWAEPTFLDLVDQLSDWSRDAPILIVCLARPELLDVRPGWGGGKLNATSALLEPLSDEECALLIENLLGPAKPAVKIETTITGTAEGNPLFVEEMLSMLIDDGLLIREDGRWIVAGDMTAVRVPPTIEALLAARLDRLETDERTVIESAAVQGKVFYEEAVVELAAEALRGSVGDSLRSLLRKELIRPDRPTLGGNSYRFRHLLIRDAAYDSIPKENRAAAHERFAHWLERAASERSTEYEEIVGYHLEQAYRYRAELGPATEAAYGLAREAAQRLGSAGRRALARRDPPAGLALISRAVSLLAPEDPLRVGLVPGLRLVQGMEDLSWADQVLTEAVDASAVSGDRRLGAHALVQRGLLRLFTAPDVTAQEFLQVAEDAIPVLEEVTDDLGLARAWRLVAQAHYLGGRAGQSADASEQALAYARRADDSFEQSEIIEWLAVALFLGPTAAGDATRKLEPLLDAVIGHPVLELTVLGSLAYLIAIQGRVSEMQKLVERGREAMQELGVAWTFPIYFADVALWMKEPVAAERHLRPGYEQLKTVGPKSHFSTITAILAQAAYAQSRYDEAEELAQEALAAARPNDVHARIISRAAKAKVLARRGEPEAAERLARAAVEFAQETDFVSSCGDAFMDLGEVLELSGRREEAAEAIRRARALFDQKGNVIGAELASARLEGLSD